MKKQLAWIFLGLVSNSFAQISPVESDWINNGLEHSVEKVYSFDNIEKLFDSSKTITWDYFPDVVTGYQTKTNRFRLQAGVGVALETGYKKKIAFQLRYALGYSNALNEPYSSAIQTKSFLMNPIGSKNSVSSGETTVNTIYNDLRFRFTYRPIQRIEIQTGIDQFHFGEGDRSMMQGQQGIVSPFIKFKGNIWQLQYTFMHQLWSEGMFTKNYRPKGVATHYLSYKILPQLHLGIFESVVYGMKDTLYNRGFEFEYLNPFIFFRPQEYSVGSTDNVILGADISYQFQKHMVYAGFLIDDFFLSEMLARKKWWANKYTLQFGVKSHFDLQSHHFFHRIEGNLVRPFTYAQLIDDVVYGNEGLPAAHPLGANFWEIYDELNWKYKNWEATLMLQYYLKGLDFIGKNEKTGLDSTDYTGGDIYVPYTWRNEEYGYTIGRGVRYQRWMVGIHLAYGLHQQRWQVFVEPRLIIEKINHQTKWNGYFTVGIQRPIGSRRRNY